MRSVQSLSVLSPSTCRFPRRREDEVYSRGVNLSYHKYGSVPETHGHDEGSRGRGPVEIGVEEG